jgi:phosphatidylinositol 4-kinase
MAKIQVDAGVYLPSNPDGVVVDIDKKSGRPLQSHAKVSFHSYATSSFPLYLT